MFSVGRKTCAPASIYAGPHTLHFLSYRRVIFVVLNSQPAAAQLGAHFPISWHALLQISFVSHLVMYLADQQEWPGGFPCASSRNCVAINSIRKRLWSLKLNVALLFRHFFVKNFLHFSDWTLTGWSCLQAVGAQSSCPWHNSGVGLQCSLRTGVLLSSYRTRDVNLKKKLWKC